MKRYHTTLLLLLGLHYYKFMTHLNDTELEKVNTENSNNTRIIRVFYFFNNTHVF